MTLAEREELRRVGRENSAAAGVVCPAHVKAAFNFEFDDIDIDVPLEELLNRSQGGMCISGVLKTTERTPRHLMSPLGPKWVAIESAV